MKRYKFLRRGHLGQWSLLTNLLYNWSVPHKNRPWLCAGRRRAKGPHWYKRKQKRRYLRRMKRLEAVWARYRKPVRLNERQLKAKHMKELLEELYRRIKRMAPYYRMKQRVFSLGVINCYDIQERKFAVKKCILEAHLEDQRILLHQLSFLKSISFIALSKKKVKLVDRLLNAKMRGELRYKEALKFRRIMYRKLALRRKFFLNVLVPLADTYHLVQRYNCMHVPIFMDELSKWVFHERKLFPKKAIAESNFLKIIAIAENKFTESQRKERELSFYIRTRYFFTVGISRLLNKLNASKEIVVELLRDGHEVLTNMFHYYDFWMGMIETSKKLCTLLLQRRLNLAYWCSFSKSRVEFLLGKHKCNSPDKMFPPTFFKPHMFDYLQKELYMRLLVIYVRGSKALKRLGHMIKMWEPDLKMWAKFKGLKTEEWCNSVDKRSLRIENLLNRLGHYLVQRKEWRNIELQCYQVMHCIIYIGVMSIINICDQIVVTRTKITPINDALFVIAHDLVFYARDLWKYKDYQYDMYKLLKRRQTFRLGRLGIHHRKFGGNKEECILVEFKLFRYFVAIRDKIMPRLRRKRMYDWRRRREKRRRHKHLMDTILPRGVTEDRLPDFSVYKVKFETLCPLCCSAERKEILRWIGRTTDFIENIDDLGLAAKKYYFGKKSMKLIHDPDHCTQPAATFLVKLRLLEDRRKMKYLGRALWTDFK